MSGTMSMPRWKRLFVAVILVLMLCVALAMGSMANAADGGAHAMQQGGFLL